MKQHKFVDSLLFKRYGITAVLGYWYEFVNKACYFFNQNLIWEKVAIDSHDLTGLRFEQIFFGARIVSFH